MEPVLCYAVGYYYPSGNLLGRFKDNVQPPVAVSSEPVKKTAEVTTPPTSKIEIKTLEPKPTDVNKINETFINEALKAHNEYRKKHFAPSLKHNPDLSAIAQKWAETVASQNKLLASGNKFGGVHLGENVSMWGNTSADRYDGKFLM